MSIFRYLKKRLSQYKINEVAVWEYYGGIDARVLGENFISIVPSGKSDDAWYILETKNR